MKAKFSVYGEPHGKGRPRFTKRGSHMIAYTDKKTADYENRIAAEYRRQVGKRFPDDSMLDMRVYAYFEIPKSANHKKRLAMELGETRPTKTPDVDNIVKIVADALNKIAYRDDKQIIDCQVRKFYSTQPRIEVIILTAKN